MRITVKMRSSRSGPASAKAGWPLFFLVWLIPVICLAQSAAGDGTVGVPWNGGPGVTETVAAIMARDKNLPVQSGMKPRQTDAGRLLPNRKNLRPNPQSPRVSQWPPRDAVSAAGLAAVSNPLAPQVAGVSFLGGQLSESGFVPPDTDAAAGPSQILMCLNGRIRVFDKAGNRGGLDTTTANFFSSLTANAVTDPHARYDRLSGRWFVTMVDIPSSHKGNGGNNKVLIAVSSGATITGSSSFTFFSFQHNLVGSGGDNGLFADFPSLGIDHNALYIGANMFSGNNFAGTSGFVINKASLIAGTLTVTAFRQLASSSGPGPYSPQGVDNDDPAATEGYFIGSDNVSSGLLVVRRVSNPGGVPSISGNITLTVPDTARPVGGVPAMGSTIGLDPSDDRLLVARMHKGSLWTAHDIEVDATGTANPLGGRVGSRWYEIINLTATPVLRQSGTLVDPAASSPSSYFMPGCTMSGQGHMVLGCSVAGLNEHAEIAVAGRLATDALGTLRAPTVVQTTPFSYTVSDGANPHRWGDYSLTTVDPNDDMTMWTAQEYCNDTGSWGVRIIQLKAPPPATPASCSPASVPIGGANLDVVVTGNSASGSGFFDPGAGFTNHIAAMVNGGGVTVNGVTYTDPTHVTLNVTIAPDAAGGARTVSVINPDGQTATSVASILALSGGNTPPTISSIPNQSINEDAATLPVAFTIGDAETPASSLLLTVASSNPILIPPLNVQLSGSGSNRTVVVTPAPDQFGVASITIRVIDGGGASASAVFGVTVIPVNDPPSFIEGPDQTVLASAGSQTVPNWATGISAGPANETGQLLNFIVSNDNASLFAVAPAIAPNGTLAYAPLALAGGSATVTVELHDNGGTANGGSDTSAPQTFTITVTPVNHAPSLAPIPNRAVHAGASVTFGASATDPDLPPQLLTFSLGPGAAAGASLNATNGRFAWTPAVSELGSNGFAITVSDNGVPALSATRSFAIFVEPPPAIHSITRSNSSVTISWSAIAGTPYLLESELSLADPAWTNVVEAVTAVTNTVSASDQIGPAPRRFYRVRVGP